MKQLTNSPNRSTVNFPTSFLWKAFFLCNLLKLKSRKKTFLIFLNIFLKTVNVHGLWFAAYEKEWIEEKISTLNLTLKPFQSQIGSGLEGFVHVQPVHSLPRYFSSRRAVQAPGWADVMAPGNALSALIIPLAWKENQIPLFHESEEQTHLFSHWGLLLFCFSLSSDSVRKVLRCWGHRSVCSITRCGGRWL